MKRDSWASIFSDALAMHEPSLSAFWSMFASKDKGSDNAGSDDPVLPSLANLIQGEAVVLPIHGMMMKRSRILCGWFSSQVFVGSDDWARIIEDALERKDLKALVLDLDTGGGQVAGTQRLADAIWKARSQGLITIAVVNEFCASAGLWIASQCERITIPASGNIGSLGVYTMHFDDTKFLSESWGIEKSVVYRGQYKAIDERPLEEEGRADLQRWIDAKYSLFVDAVARGRGLSSAEVMSRWGDSRLFSGSEAVDSGLADEFGTLQEVLGSLKAGRRGVVSIATPADSEAPDEEPEEGDSLMKINPQGQILDGAGKVVGTLADLELDAATVQKHFAAQTSELIDSAVKTAKDAAKLEADASAKRLEELVAAVGPEKGFAAWKDGKTVEGAKAALADELAATLKAKDEEIAKLKAGSAASSEPEKKAPVFSASDAGGLGDGKKADQIDAKDQPFAADWNANKDNCQEGFGGDFKAYAAFRRHAVR